MFPTLVKAILVVVPDCQIIECMWTIEECELGPVATSTALKRAGSGRRSAFRRHRREIGTFQNMPIRQRRWKEASVPHWSRVSPPSIQWVMSRRGAWPECAATDTTLVVDQPFPAFGLPMGSSFYRIRHGQQSQEAAAMIAPLFRMR